MAEERLDYLPGKKRYIFQRSDIFTFSIDAILLAKFVTIPKKCTKIIDLCTGNGAIPLMLSLRTKAEIQAVEIQKTLYDLLTKSIAYNELEEQVIPIHQDIVQLKDEVKWGSYDVVTCNPPYFPITKDHYYNDNEKLTYARHEIACSLEDVVRISAKLLNFNGKFALVHRPERIVEIITLMEKYKMAPKRIQFVHPRKNKEANIVLIEGVRGGKRGTKTLPPIIVYGDGTEYTKEFKQYYEQ